VANRENIQTNKPVQADCPEVEEFLNEINLGKYKDLFVQNGIENLDIILELQEIHLEELKVPLGHKLKIAKKIKDMRKLKGLVEANT
jgi:hypothetical protein